MSCFALVKPAFGFTARLSRKRAMKPMGTRPAGSYGTFLDIAVWNTIAPVTRVTPVTPVTMV